MRSEIMKFINQESLGILDRQERKIKVLIVEHSASFQKIFEELLKELENHFKWLIVNDFDFSKKEKILEYDIVIIDLYLQNREGLKIYRNLKKIDVENNIKFIISHGLGGLDEVNESIKNNEIQYRLWKPINIEEFYEQIIIDVEKG